MRAHGFLLLLLPGVIGIAACDDWDSRPTTNANEIIFAIEQRVDPATGKTTVEAAYEFLGLAKKGSRTTHFFRDAEDDGSCYFERLDERLGHPLVEGGVATWTGGTLPAGGLKVLANEPKPATHDGPGWGVNELITFEVSGFAMPPVHRLAMTAPRLGLEITALAPAAEIKPTDDVRVTWTPTDQEEAEGSRILVSVETDEGPARGGGLQCFVRAREGKLVIPSEWVARLFASVDPTQPIHGVVRVASHRQITYVTRGDWVVYVVATSVHREQAFTGTR